MEFWLTFNNGAESLRLPVPPPSFTIQKGTTINVVNINDLGDVGIIGKGTLAAITIDGIFPSQVYPFVQYKSFPKPLDCVAIIEKWRQSGKPIRLIITDTGINIPMCIETFSYGEQGGTRDIYFSLGLKEYRFTKIMNVSNPTQTTQRDSSNKTASNVYIVKAGDTLWDISKKVYGDGSKYTVIMQKNNIKDPKKLQVGQRLVI